MEHEELSKEKTFAELLKYERGLRGWSQARMAEEIGATPNRISSWERGVALPSAYFREKLCSLLAMNAQELGLLAASKEALFYLQEHKQPEKQTAVALAEPLNLPDLDDCSLKISPVVRHTVSWPGSVWTSQVYCSR